MNIEQTRRGDLYVLNAREMVNHITCQISVT